MAPSQALANISIENVVLITKPLHAFATPTTRHIAPVTKPSHAFATATTRDAASVTKPLHAFAGPAVGSVVAAGMSASHGFPGAKAAREIAPFLNPLLGEHGAMPKKRRRAEQNLPQMPAKRQRVHRAAHAETDDDIESTPRRAEVLAFFDKHLAATSLQGVRTSVRQQNPKHIPSVDDESDTGSDSASQLSSDPGQAIRRTFAQSRPLAPIAAPNAGYRFNIHGPEQFGFKDAISWRNEDTPEQEEESLVNEVEHESESEQDENADENHEPTANEMKKRSAASLKSRIPREVRYVFVVPPGDGHDGEKRMFKQLHDFPADVARYLVDIGLAECRQSDAKKLRLVSYLAKENESRSLQASRCMVSHVLSRTKSERQPRKDTSYCCSTCQNKQNRLCCYLQLYKKDSHSEAMLFVFPKRNTSSSWQDLQFWLF